jgi:hypothetical protein
MQQGQLVGAELILAMLKTTPMGKLGLLLLHLGQSRHEISSRIPLHELLSFPISSCVLPKSAAPRSIPESRMTLTSVATIGLSLAIPTALVGSLFIPDSSAGAITVLSLLGAGMVCAGFGLLGWQGWKESSEGSSTGTGAILDDNEVEST